MGLRWLSGMLHRALMRPSDPPDVDYQARKDHEKRMRELMRKLGPLLNLQAQANVERGGRRRWREE